MTSWQTILDNFLPEYQLELTEEEQAYIPVYATNAFAADYKDTRCLFAQFQEPAIWCEGIGTTWRFTSDNSELTTRKFRFLISHLDEVKNFDFVHWTATYNDKQIKWDTLYSEWKYLNNRKVHFQSPSTSEVEETQPSSPREFKKEGSNNSEESDKDNKSDKESIHSKSSTDEDILNISNLLQEAETQIVATIQKLTSHPSTPSPQQTPSHPASMLPGSSKLSIPEESSFPTPPLSKGKAKEEPLPQTFTSSSRSSETTPVPTATQPKTPPTPKGSPKGIPPIPPPHPCLGRTGPPQRPPSPPAPPPPPVVMAGNIATPKLLGSTPDPYDGNPTKAQAFWNTLANYYTMNNAIYDTDDKKVPAALTNFKAGTQGGDWASDRIAEALAANPTNYRTWAQFQTAFQKQFIPPEVQQEAIKGMHDMYMGNREFNDWYQDWTHHAWQSGVDDNTKMYAFRHCINLALQQKLVALSPQPATLPDLVDKAWDLDRSFHMFAPQAYTSSTGGGCGRGRFTPWIQAIEEEEPTAEINATCRHG